jgi:hypothetical protein
MSRRTSLTRFVAEFLEPRRHLCYAPGTEGLPPPPIEVESSTSPYKGVEVGQRNFTWKVLYLQVQFADQAVPYESQCKALSQTNAVRDFYRKNAGWVGSTPSSNGFDMAFTIPASITFETTGAEWTIGDPAYHLSGIWNAAIARAQQLFRNALARFDSLEQRNLRQIAPILFSD